VLTAFRVILPVAKLLRFGTPEQKAKWLRPLLDGDVRSCFAMTEPGVASSGMLPEKERNNRPNVALPHR
jgi:alkylation response protein AidB-like acyl-CoA dehydrogenase